MKQIAFPLYILLGFIATLGQILVDSPHLEILLVVLIIVLYKNTPIKDRQFVVGGTVVFTTIFSLFPFLLGVAGLLESVLGVALYSAILLCWMSERDFLSD